MLGWSRNGREISLLMMTGGLNGLVSVGWLGCWVKELDSLSSWVKFSEEKAIGSSVQIHPHPTFESITVQREVV